jgi:hypothetical protein
MFNRAYTRIMAAAAVVLATVGLRRDDNRPVHAPHRAYEPPSLVPRSIPVFRPGRAHSVGGSLSWGKWRYPRKLGAMARRLRQIERGILTASTGSSARRGQGQFPRGFGLIET